MEPDKPLNSNRETSAVREEDIQPYTALRWVGTLFKAAAVFLGVAILAEFIAGLRFQGTDALPVLLGEVMRMLVLGIVLWGAGDLVRLLIDMGHDFRAGRVLLGRISSRIPVRDEAEEEGALERGPGEHADESYGPESEAIGEEPRGPHREAA